MRYKTFIVAFISAAFIAALVTPLLARLAHRWNLVDKPDARRVHTRQIPRIGGIGITMAFFAPILGLILWDYFMWDNHLSVALLEKPGLVAGILVGGCAMLALGVADDLWGVRARYKLIVQVIAAIVVIALGIRIDVISIPVFGVVNLGLVGILVTVLWIVGIVNAINLIDGLDGLAAGVVFFVAILNFTVGIMTGNILVCLFNAALAGSILGFLMWNFNPARIFMGDSGSLFLGMMIATTALVGTTKKGSTAVALMVPIVALGVPIMDTLVAVVRRSLERRPIFSADRGHIHHKLLDMGLTHRRAVLVLYTATVLLTLSAIGIYAGRNWEVGLAMFVALIVMIGIVRTMGVHRLWAKYQVGNGGAYPGLSESLFVELPLAMRRLDRADSTDEVEQALRDLVEATGAEGLDLAVEGEGIEYRFEATEAESPEGRSEDQGTVVTYPVSADEAIQFTITWHDSREKLPTQGKVLLRLLGDACAGRVLELCEAGDTEGTKSPPSHIESKGA